MLYTLAISCYNCHYLHIMFISFGFFASKTLKLFYFPIYWFWGYVIKAIIETSRALYIIYLLFAYFCVYIYCQHSNAWYICKCCNIFVKINTNILIWSHDIKPLSFLTFFMSSKYTGSIFLLSLSLSHSLVYSYQPP